MLPRPRGSLRPGASLAAAVLATLAVAAMSSSAEARSARGSRAKAKTTTHKKVARSKVVPNQEGKVAIFPVRYDEESGFTAQIARILQAHGLEVSTDTKRVDTAEQFRELSTALGFAAYVDADYLDAGPRSRISIVVRNGYTGRKAAAVTFRESNLHLRAEVEDNLWTRIGPAIAKSCADASKPRKRDRDPMMIEAGTPLADK